MICSHMLSFIQRVRFIREKEAARYRITDSSVTCETLENFGPFSAYRYTIHKS